MASIIAVGKITIGEAMKAIWPFLGASVLVLLLVTYIPGLSLWLDVQSVSGEIASELGVEDGPAGEGEPVELRVRTVSGDVRIVSAKGATAFHDA